MRRFRVVLTAFDRVDWGRLVEHLTAALLTACGGALVARPDAPFGDVIEGAVKIWFAASLVYTGGFIQNAERLSDDGAGK